MDHGAVWGHGAQRGSEFSATSLHLVAEAVGDYLAMAEYGKTYAELPASFYLPFVAKLIPYSWAKTWHLQLMVFWIATTWVAHSAEFFERGAVHFLGYIRIVPDLIIIVLGVIPLAYFLISTYPHLKAAEIKDDESGWERLGIEL